MDAEIEKRALSVETVFQRDLQAETTATSIFFSTATALMNAGAKDTQNAPLTQTSSPASGDGRTTFSGKSLATPDSHRYPEATEGNLTSYNSYSDQSEFEIKVGAGKYNPTSMDYTALLSWHSIHAALGSSESTTANTFDDIGDLN
jgi:hypothetical protein